MFTLAVDDFGIKYFHHDDVDHLHHALRQDYQISTDCTGRHCCGLTIDWNYKLGYVDISMPGYVLDALKKFLHVPPRKPQYAHHEWTTPVYD